MGAVLSMVVLSGCVDLEEATPNVKPAPVTTATPDFGNSETITVSRFTRIVRQVEPVAEQFCREQTSGANCDFKIVVETNPKAPANAYQSVDETGRPVLTFTVALIADVHNIDELAFIMGHEAAHHISGHLDQTQSNAVAGGLLGGVLAAAIGADASTIETIQNLGATVGARSYSKSFELEADQLGTIIAHKAGYNPIRGAAYFTRIPDPGNSFLGSHPPNDARIETVRRTMATL
jgi:Zn-dependent protease with chaperone function